MNINLRKKPYTIRDNVHDDDGGDEGGDEDNENKKDENKKVNGDNSSDGGGDSDGSLNKNGKDKKYKLYKQAKEKKEEDSLDILILNNGWNDINENLIVSIGENSMSYKWMHEKCSVKYARRNKALSLFTIVFNSILSVQTIFNNDQSMLLNIVFKIFIWIVTLISIINNFLDYQKLSAKHSFASNAFSELYRDIQKQTCLYRKDRLNAVKYVTNIFKKFDNLENTSPDIDNDILREFTKKFKDSNIQIPNIADKLSKIDIIKEIPNPNDSFIINMENLGIKKQNVEIKKKNDKNEMNNDDNKTDNIYLNNIHVKSNLSKIKNSLKLDGELSENNDVRSRILEEKDRKRTALLEYELDRLKSSNYD